MLAKEFIFLLLVGMNSIHTYSIDRAKVVGMHRYAVKGLSPDTLATPVHLDAPSGTFPNDRRFALLQRDKSSAFKGDWLHKENFLCAFTHPQLLATLQTSFDDPTCTLSVHERDGANDGHLLLRTQLDNEAGRQQLGSLLSDLSGEKVTCIEAPSSKFQFGNTSSGWKQRSDTRTLHIINRQTVRVISDTLGIPLDPLRFRPNIVVDAEPWSEFTDWVPHRRSLVAPTSPNNSQLQLKVISKTVRCNGVSVDPHDPANRVLDIPNLLNDNFAFGPYLGVYAVTDESGLLSLGDTLHVE